MKTPEQSSPTAQEAYERNYMQVEDLIVRIANKVHTDYHSNQPKDWADVGNLGHTIEVLQDIAEFLGASA